MLKPKMAKLLMAKSMNIELRYFDIDEFTCSETGSNKMSEAFLLRIDELRHRCGFPFVITSGYRSETHTAERTKQFPGTHTQGIACDIAVYSGSQRLTVVREALAMGFNGIGVAHTFVHVDDRDSTPVMWCY